MATLTPVPEFTEEQDSQEQELHQQRKRVRRNWGHKFRDAFRGIKFGVRGQSSFFVHFFFAALVIVAAVVLHCTTTEWCILIACIGFVLVAEMFNSAIETLFRGLPENARNQVWPCLDIAAGAVLIASITAATIGLIVFLNRFWIVWMAAAS